MESRGDEDQHSKRSKPGNHALLIIPKLPLELITEILSRLPVKSLLRFRCVAQYWLALISSPKFIKTHLTLSSNNKDYTHHRLLLNLTHPFRKACSLRSLLYDSVMGESGFNFSLEEHLQLSLFAGSANGLICFGNRSKELFLWNPSIRKYKKLPDFNAHLTDANPFLYGFGYDEIHDDYKAVFGCFIVGYLLNPEFKCYSLMSDSWRSIHSLQNVHKDMYFHSFGKFVNEKLHWSYGAGPSLHDDWNIISFDLADEKWGKLELPPFGEEYGRVTLEVLGNNFSMFYCRARSLDVWVMNEYGVGVLGK